MKLLDNLEDQIQRTLDKLITIRDACNPEHKYKYRYVTRKLENMLGEIHKAQDKVENK